MLVAELPGKIKVLPPPYTQPTRRRSCSSRTSARPGVQQGIFDIALDPNFATNHYYYVFYTLGTPNRDRLSRFTANATLTGTVAGQRARPLPGSAGRQRRAPRRRDHLRQRRQALLHDRRALRRRPPSQSLTSPRGKIHRINPDGTVPTDNPFYDGTGPNVDSIWALRPAQPVPRLLRRADRQALHRRRRRQRRLDRQGGGQPRRRAAPTTAGRTARAPAPAPCTSPLYSYPHNGRDAAVTGGFVYHGTQFPSSYQGSYFFADYTQNWIKRLTFDASGNVTGVFNFEPADGSVDGPYGDIVYLTEGPDGALYYVDLGYSDIGGTFGVSKIRRIRYVAVEPGAGRGRVGEPDLRAGAARRQLLERGLVRSRGPAADLLVDVRRRHHLDGGEPDPHVRAGRASTRRGSRSPTASTRTFSHADHDQRRQPADGDDPVAAPTAAPSAPAT